MKHLLPSRRFTVVCDEKSQSRLLKRFLEIGAMGYTLVACRGRGKSHAAVVADGLTGRSVVKIEMIVTDTVAQKLLDYLRAEVFPKESVMVYVDDVGLAEGDVY